MLATVVVQQEENRVRLSIYPVLLLVILLFLLIAPITQANGEQPVSTQDRTSSARGGIILMRHGEAGHNVENRYNSSPDHPAYKPRNLTELGREQARLSADALLSQGISSDNVCLVLVSPLPRTQETANIVNGKLQIASFRKKTVDGLIENQVGDREGQLLSDYKDKDPWFPENPESFGGESYARVEQRVRDVLNYVFNDSGCDLEKQYVLLVSHGVAIYIMLNLLTGAGEKIKPASYRIIHDPAIIRD